MDVITVGVSANHHLVVRQIFRRESFGKFQGQLRGDFSRLKGLDDQVGNHILFRVAFPAGFRFIDLLAECKFLPCGIRAALI